MALLCAASLLFEQTPALSSDAGMPADIQYVALGDSITNGYYAGSEAFAVEYRNHLAGDLNTVVTLTNLGVNGWTSADLLDAVEHNPTYQTAVADADVVTILVGMNDFLFAASAHVHGACGGVDNQDCLRSLAGMFEANVAATVEAIRTLNPDPILVVGLSEIFYPTTGNPTTGPYYSILHPYLVGMNQVVHQLSDANGYGVAPLYQAFNGSNGDEDPYASELLAGDGIHPSPLGFDIIASAFRSLGYAPLASDDNAPWITDSDGDGCPNDKERGPDPRQGGQRDPYNPWDYYNPGQDGANRIDDITAVVRSYGHDSGDPLYNVNYDRTMLDNAHPWQFGPPNDTLRPFDITAALFSYSHDCS